MSTETSTPDASASATRRQTAVMRRLAKIREHKDFAEAMQHVPPAEEDLDRAAARIRGGAASAGIGLAFLLLGALGTVPVGLGIALGVIGLAVGGHFLYHGWKLRKTTLVDPLVRVCALVADRRSETTPTWLGGRTLYFFALQLEDGTSGEYRYPGRGTQDDLLVKGQTGVAFLRGQTLLAWKNIRV
ncbi:hypothetical protein Pla163_31930 [Planctomycetes bacterium Pla163]|uniref:Uncharacterized protein n=1 Tax=Rohdeia mirabilis TaxID=2528008 RepID=A0A518D3L5_9BACT|nr:hypothetical protein Pla163_31930 [Planctomycetes bacterium Pla163]